MKYIILFYLIIIVYSQTDYNSGCGYNCYWKYFPNNSTLHIIGEGEMKKTSTNFPWSKYANNVTTIVIDYGLTTIENYSFSDFSCLTTVHLPNSMQQIGQYAFSQCTELKEINIPDFIEIIEMSAFENCTSLIEITIPRYTTELKKFAFANCSSLQNVTFLSSNLIINDGVFWNCISLSTVNYYGFNEPICYSNEYCIDESFDCKNDETSSNCSPFSCNCESLTNIIVPKDYLNNSLCGIEIVRRDNNDIPIELKTQGECGVNCKWFYIEENKTLIINGTGDMTDWKQYQTPWIEYREEIISIIVFSGIKRIGNDAFYNFTKLKEVILPEKLNYIGEYAFGSCTSLESITMQSGIYHIESGAFIYCSSLKEVTIPQSVNTIGNYAFGSCTKLKKVVSYYDLSPLYFKGVFWNCPMLSTFIYYGNYEPDLSVDGKQCSYEKIGCGNENELIDCSPFSCKCDSLKNVIVTENYHSKTFFGLPTVLLEDQKSENNNSENNNSENTSESSSEHKNEKNSENETSQEETKNEMIYVYISFGIVCVFVIIGISVIVTVISYKQRLLCFKPKDYEKVNTIDIDDNPQFQT